MMEMIKWPSQSSWPKS